MNDTKSEPKTPKTKDSGAAKSTPEKKASASKESPKKTKSGPDGKSARESVGGSKEVHYGYFSNIKTPEYRSGWDTIWGKGKKSSGRKQAEQAEAKVASRKPPTPVRLYLDIAELPEDLRKGLTKAARTKLKKLRVNYDKREAAGAVEWQIECWVKRI